MEDSLKVGSSAEVFQAAKFVTIGAPRTSTILAVEVSEKLIPNLSRIEIYFDSRIMLGRDREEITYLQKRTNELLCHRIGSFL